MDITFNCDKCGQNLVVDAAGAGHVIDCPKCGLPVTVPRQDAEHPKPVPSVPQQLAASPPETKQCLYCAETIKAQSIVCRYCGRDLVAKRLTEAVTAKVQGPLPALTSESSPPKGSNPLPKILTVLVIIAVIAGGFFAYNFWKDQQRAKAEAEIALELAVREDINARDAFIVNATAHFTDVGSVRAVDDLAESFSKRGLRKAVVYRAASELAKADIPCSAQAFCDFISPLCEVELHNEKEVQDTLQKRRSTGSR